jgi:hypothetical protein
MPNILNLAELICGIFRKLSQYFVLGIRKPCQKSIKYRKDTLHFYGTPYTNRERRFVGLYHVQSIPEETKSWGKTGTGSSCS